MKKRIGARMKELRGERKQEAIEEESGVDRGIIGKIERGASDYRINSFLKVLTVLRADEHALLPDDSLEESLQKKLVAILRKGRPEDRAYIISTIERIADEASHDAHGPPGKARQSA